MRTNFSSILLLAAIALTACGEDDPAGTGGDASSDASTDGGDDVAVIDASTDADAGDDSGDFDADADAAADTVPSDTGTDVADVVDVAEDAADSGDVEPDVVIPVDPSAPEVTVCPRAESFDPTVCEVVPGTDAGALLIGQVLTPAGAYVDGEVLLDGDGLITCVGCDCASTAPADVTTVVCPAAAISPGLINGHDHITYTQNDPGSWGEERFEHRHDWSDGLRGHSRIPVAGRATREQIQWGELRQLIAGTTSMAGSGSAPGLVRNLDASDESLEGLPPIDIISPTFPLDDGNGVFRTADCSYPELPTIDELDGDCWLAHVSEGIDAEARNEFLCLSSAERGGVDMLADSTGIVHGISLTALDARQLASSGTGVVWSPRSNISLYGNTAPVLLYQALGVDLGIGTDWTASGSMNLLRELRCAAEFSENNLGGALSSWELWKMATIGNARVLGVDDTIGVLEPGRTADIALFAISDVDDPWSAVTAAEPDDVLLVLRAGEAMFGEPELIAGLRDPAACETIAGDVCGAQRLVCVDAAAETTLAALTSANTSIYGLFFCGTPTEEPTCVPSRQGEYDGFSEADRDGDGLANAADLCPDVFDPVRPVDNGAQPDFDADGIGDACDVCPLGGEGGLCAPLPIDDRDLDEVDDEVDNCPATPNFDQANTDADGEGDACDLCPNDANELGWACPVEISQIKTGSLARDVRVTVTGVITAIVEDSFWIQVADDAADSPEYGAIYVFLDNADPLGAYVPALGDEVQVDGAVTVYRSFYELTAVRRVRYTRAAVVTPRVVDVFELNATAATRAAWDGVLVTVPDAEIIELAPTATGTQEDAAGEYGILGGALIDELLYAIAPVPLLGSVYSVTGIVRTPNGQLKFAPRTADDVELVGFGVPRLQQIVPGDYYIAVGDVGTTFPQQFVVSIDRPAPADFFIGIESDDPSVLGVDETVIFVEGETSAIVSFSGEAAGEALVTAFDGRFSRSASVVVFDDAAPRRLVSASPNPLVVNLDRSINVEVTIDAPAPAGGVDVIGSFGGGSGAVMVPLMTNIPERELSAVFPVYGVTPGLTTITLTFGADTISIPVEVLDAVPVRAPTADDDMLFTEVMPKSRAGSGDTGEWFEMYNNSGDILDLSGCEVYDGAGGFTITEAFVEPGAYVTFAVVDDVAANGGVDPLVVYGTAIALNNSGDTIGLDCGGVVVDEIVYTSSWVGDAAAHQLDDRPEVFTTTANDTTSNWCRATTAYGTGAFLGTPGAASDCR